MVMCSQPTGEPKRTNKFVKSVVITDPIAVRKLVNEKLFDHEHGKIEIQSILIQYTED